MRAAFEAAAAKAGPSIVRVRCAGEDAALGTVVAPDGWVLTKAGELRGTVACRLADGSESEARLVGFHRGSGLALLKADVRGLTPVEWGAGEPPLPGRWVMAPGPSGLPIAVGIANAAARLARGPTTSASWTGGYLGIRLADPGDRAEVARVLPGTPASRAGFRQGDVIVSIGSGQVAGRDDLFGLLARRSPGDLVAARVRRGAEELDLTAGLEIRDSAPPAGLPGGPSKVDEPGPLEILRHDTWLAPSDCGGPLVDLDGVVVGINAVVEGRVETYAVTSRSVRRLLRDMMSGAYAPSEADRDWLGSR